MSERAWTSAGNLWRDTEGAILPYVTLMMLAVMGVSMLAVDGARFMSLQTQMQGAADAMALAGAAELNGQANARTRADNAMANLVTNGFKGMGINTPVQLL